MSGSMMMQMMGGAGVVSSDLVVGIGDSKAGSTASCFLSLAADGTITFSGNLSNASPNWYLPSLAAVGNNYWCWLVPASGTPPALNNGGLAYNTVYQLNASRTFGYLQSANGSRNGNFILQIARDAAMTQVLNHSTFNMNATRES